MLLPALNQAREKARSITCASNEKQLGVALAAYVLDHDDFYPPLSYAWPSNAWGSSRSTWYMMLYQYVGIDKPTSVASAYGMVSKNSIFSFPTQKQWNDNGIYMSYGYNLSYFGTVNYSDKNGSGVRTSLIKKSSDLLVYTDTWYSYTPLEYQELGNYAIGGGWNICFRHNKCANSCYADGHVQPDRYNFLGAGNGACLPLNGNGEFWPWRFYKDWSYGFASY